MNELELATKALPKLFRARFERELAPFYSRVGLTNPALAQARRDWMYWGLEGKPQDWVAPERPKQPSGPAPFRPKEGSALPGWVFTAEGVLAGKTAAIASWSKDDSVAEKAATLAVGALAAAPSLFISIVFGCTEAY